jgi:ATP-dependent Clp protease protease subunit
MDHFKMVDTIAEEMKLKSALERRIILNEEVSRETIFKVKYFFEKLKRIDALRPDEPLKPITLVIDSYGGEVYAGLSLVGVIEQYKKLGYTIITEVSGVAMSMGFVIALAGSKRTAVPYSRFMLHQPSSSAWGKMQDMIEEVEEVEFLWSELKTIIRKYSSITEEYMEQARKHKQDIYLTPEQMLDFNAIDEVY